MLNAKHFSILSKARKGLFIFVLSILFSGCAQLHHMAVNHATTYISLGDEGLLLMSLEIENKFKPEYQPMVTVVYLETPGAETKEDRHHFVVDLEGTQIRENGSSYLLRMSLPAGEYIIRGAYCMYQGAALESHCLMPIHADVEVVANVTKYLGRVKGTIHEHKEGQLRAGGIIPFVDQSVTGFFTGTWDVVISDTWDEDKELYRTFFPVLAQTEIEKDIMQAFDKQCAYAWWKNNGGFESDKNVVKSGKKLVLKTEAQIEATAIRDALEAEEAAAEAKKLAEEEAAQETAKKESAEAVKETLVEEIKEEGKEEPATGPIFDGEFESDTSRVRKGKNGFPS
ncbi:MAG: hypothetical protein A6F71_09210 [Cycloclasticus sp. symbiont of Poecilosclerida sp. M]|nr:MAG: hypothetical protein A6F71_09210 [Cycloclasticus sp. symbiont of Poecilosclerida sp. M]